MKRLMQGAAIVLIKSSAGLVAILFLLSQLKLFWHLPIAEPAAALLHFPLLDASVVGSGVFDGTETGQLQPGRKQVTWLHLHKFGGTFMTKMARLQGEQFPFGNINANWMPDFCSTSRAHRIDCAGRTGSGSNVTWSAMERELDDDDFCEGALLGTMLREPLGALQSVLAHDRYDKEAILNTLRTCHEGVPAKHFMYSPPEFLGSNRPLCLPPWDTYHHFDNFAIRTLSGAYAEPPCTINRTHLDAAKARLQRMDVVMILEQLGEQVAQLRASFRWNTALVQPGRHVNRKPNSTKEQLVAFTLQEMGFLQKLNALDVELYEFGSSLARDLTSGAQKHLAAIGDELPPPEMIVEDVRPLDALRLKVAHRLSLRGRHNIETLRDTS